MPSVSNVKHSPRVVEFLDQGRLRPGLIVREQGEKAALLGPDGREKIVHRDLILVRHHERNHADPATWSAAAAEIAAERDKLAAELDLKLLWEVVREQARSFNADELAELFFGKRSATATAVVLDALLNDRLYFSRRHLEFTAESPERVERLRTQWERMRLKTETSRRFIAQIKSVLAGSAPTAEETAPLAEQLRGYLQNPATRSGELTAILTQAAGDLNPAEAAYEVLDRIGQAPDAPRFVYIGALPTAFSEAAIAEAQSAEAPDLPAAEPTFTVTIDDEETVEIDDGLSCQPLPGGGLRVRIHIALVAGWVAKDGAMDREAKARASTVYLPEATVRMLPDAISCESASLIAGVPRAVLTTEVDLAADGEIATYRIYPATIKVDARLTYDETSRLLSDPALDQEPAAGAVRAMAAMAERLRERRRIAGAMLIARRETKVRVRDGQIELSVIESSSKSRLMVAEYMVLANHLAARFSSERNIPIIYRIQPQAGTDLAGQHPRLSLFAGFHAGIGLPCYAQLSSPIRRYADLVLQRQLMAALSGSGEPIYQSADLLTVLANAETVDSEGKELERRAKRYWALRYLQQLAPGEPLIATVVREGATAELVDYAVRGTLRGAPNLPNQTRVRVRLTSIDPLRGWLAMEYAGPAPDAA